MTKKPILITGATGFVGRHLLHALVDQEKDLQPFALVRDPKAWKRYDWTKDIPTVQTIKGSVTDPKSWQEDPKLKNLAGIFHLAAVIRHSRQDPEDMYHTNIEGLLNMVRLAAAHRCRLVFVSTSGTVGCFKQPDQWADEHSPYCEKEVGTWPYYNSKIQAEKQARQLAEKLKVELVIVRPPVLLGPGDHRYRATSHILRMLRGKLPFLLRGGIHFVDIRDASDALIRAMKRPHPRPIYHLSGTACSIDEFFHMVQKVSGVAPPWLHLPANLARAVATATARFNNWLPGGTHPILPDPVVFEMASKYWDVRSRYAKEELGFVSRDPLQTLSDTVKWLRKNHVDLKRQ